MLARSTFCAWLVSVITVAGLWAGCAVRPTASGLDPGAAPPRAGAERPPALAVSTSRPPSSVPSPAPSAAIPAPSAPTGAGDSATPPEPHDAGRVELIERAMGTRVTLVSFPNAQHDARAVETALEAALAEIRRLEALMSPHRADSDVGRINAAAGRAAVPVGPDSVAVIGRSLWIAEKSGGVFDITFASMGPLWRFSPGIDAVVPEPADIARARARIGFRRIVLDRTGRTVRLLGPETRIDLGGIAKGYAVDRAAEVLHRAGLRSFFVQAGGDLYVSGRKPDGEPWRVGVRDPRGPDESFFASLPVEDHAFSTAGDYERSFFAQGKRYHHIIDPRTGYPATASRSVSMWAPDALTADMLDDAVFILGPKRGLELVESVEGCGAVIVDADNRVWISKRLEGVVQTLRAPTDGP